MGYSYSNTNGTGNRTGGGGITVTTNATLGGSSGTIDKLVNGNMGANGTNAVWFNLDAANIGKIITFDFGSARTVRQCRVYTDSSTAFVVLAQWAGSNDNTTFTNIGAPHSMGGVQNGAYVDTQLINNVVAYRYYRLTLGTTNGGPWVEEFEFFIDGSTDDEGDTSYAYPLGGDSGLTHAGFTASSGGDGISRAGRITITTTYPAAGGESNNNLINGLATNDSTASWEYPNSKTDLVFKFQFDVAQRITAITHEQNLGTDEGTYTLAGSNDDSSYTTIATGLVIAASGFKENTFTNTTAYTYYRLTQTAGTTSSSPWIHEIYFKCCPTVKETVGSVVYVAVGTNCLMTSTDGIRWYGRPMLAGGWDDVCWSSTLSLWCAVANSGTNRVATSPDGITWTARTPSSVDTWHGVAWSPSLNLFVAVSNGGTAMSSPDGTTWTARTIANNSWDSVVWAPGLSNFFAVSDDTNAAITTRVAHSGNGTSWTQETTPAGVLGWVGIAFAPSLTLLAACNSTGTTSRVMTSPGNGVWTQRTTPNFTMRGICWSIAKTLFCIVGNSGSSTANVATSPDGTTWTSRTPITPLRDVVFAEGIGRFAAVGDSGALIVSTDGTNWNFETAGAADNFFSVAANAGTGAVTITAATAQTLFAPTQAAAAAEKMKLAGAQTLFAPTQAAAAAEKMKAAPAQTLFAPSQAMAAKEIEKAVAAQTLFAPTQEIDVTEFYRAAVAVTLFAPTLSATDVEIEPAAIAQTLTGFMQAAAAFSSSLDAATAAQTLFAPTQDAEAVESELASADQTLFGLTQEFDANVWETGAIDQTLLGLTQEANAVVIVSGEANAIIVQTLRGFTQRVTVHNSSHRRHLGFPGGERARDTTQAKIEAGRVVGIAELEFFRSGVYARGVDARVPPPEVARHNLTSSAYHKARPVTVPAQFKGKPK